MPWTITNLLSKIGVFGADGSTIATTANPLPTAESTAAGAPNAASLPVNAVQVGGVGKDTAPTAVTDGRPVRWWLSRIGVGMAAITDAAGANIATIKAASAAAAFTDAALTTDIRPGGVLPAAAALADAEVNTTTMSRLGARLSGFNGTTWDRLLAVASVLLVRSTECTPTGKLWTFLYGTQVANTSAGTLVIPSGTGQLLRRLAISNQPNATTVYIFYYHGAAPAYGSASNLIGFSVIGSANATQGLDFPGGIPVPNGVTVIASSTPGLYTVLPTAGVIAWGQYGT